MTEAHSEETVTGAAEGRQEAAKDISNEGRYIPYGGGCLGWFENSGVMKVELGNNYTFHEALDAAEVRRRLFERWGDDVNRRAEARQAVEKEVSLTFAWGKESREAFTKDVSSHGLRVQFIEEVDLKKGAAVQVQLLESGPGSPALFDISSQVMWVSKVGRRRPVWNVGVSFTNITPETETRLKGFLFD